MDLKKITVIISIIALILVSFTVIFTFLSLNNLRSNNISSDNKGDLILIGQYTGSHRFNVTMIVLDDGIVEFTNGSFWGAEVVVRGNLTVINCTLNINILIESNGNATFINSTISDVKEISCFGNSKVHMENVFVMGTLDEDITNLYAFDQARLFMLNVGLVCEFYGSSELVNGTNLARQSGSSIPILKFYQYSNCTIQNSTINTIMLGTPYLKAFGMRYEIMNCSLQYLSIFGNLSATMRDYSYLYQGIGWENSTLYKDSTCNVVMFINLDNSSMKDI